MPDYKMVVMSRPTECREEEYNEWYQNTHLHDLVALEGFCSARRYKLAQSLREGNDYPYMAVYKIETTDIGAVVDNLTRAATDGRIRMSDAIDTATSYAAIYEDFGSEVS